MESTKRRNINSNYNDNEFQKDLERSMKEENDALVGQVYSSVKSIKQHALEMKDKIRISNMQCEEMDKKYSEANSLIGSTIKQLGDLFRGNTNYWCYLVIFIIVIIFILYRIGK